MLRWVPPDPTEPGVQGSYIIIGRASGPSNLFAANLSGHDEFGLPYNIGVVLECKNHTFLSSEAEHPGCLRRSKSRLAIAFLS